jgi:radical SAM protein with 4Fe4S-binding SPASM domain
MTIETVDKIIKEYDPKRIIFFGGEPLVEINLMEQILQKYYGTRKFQIVTSGLVNYEKFILDINSKYPFNEIQISWDGIDNTSRISADGVNRQDEIYNKILWTIDQGVKFDVKCVLNNLNIHNMYETCKEFNRLASKGVSGEFVIAHRENFSEEFFEQFEKQLPLCLELQDHMSMEFLNKIMMVIWKDTNTKSCDAGHYHVFRPNGELSHCTILSQFPDYNLTDDELAVRCKHKDCQNCEIAFMCDGGCRYERVVTFGDKWKENYCSHTCRVNKIYYNVISKWLNDMNNSKRWELNDLLLRYSNYKKMYGGISR